MAYRKRTTIVKLVRRRVVSQSSSVVKLKSPDGLDLGVAGDFNLTQNG
jgi:hypothetical protein